VSQANNVSKFNPHHDELGRFTSGGAGRRVSRMPKSKGKSKPNIKRKQEKNNPDTERVVRELSRVAGKEVAEKWKPFINAALNTQDNPKGNMDAALKIGGKTFASKETGGAITSIGVLDMVADAIGVEALTGISAADFESGKSFRRLAQKPKEKPAKSNARFGLADTKTMDDRAVVEERRRLKAMQTKLEDKLPTISNKLTGFTEDFDMELFLEGRKNLPYIIPEENRSIEIKTATRRYVSNATIKRKKAEITGKLAAIKSRLKDLDAEIKSRKISVSSLSPSSYNVALPNNPFVETIVEKFNPNHDELGRFTFGSGMGAPARNIKPVAKLAAHIKVKKDWTKVRAVDSRTRKQIVKAFDDAPQRLSEEQLKSWDEAEKVINQQFDLLTKKLGVKVQFVDYDPYKNSQDMFDSFRDTGVLKILKTSVTGSHTYWSDKTNDKFRAVHDAFGHLGTGVGFDRHGEQAAYEAHKSMFPPSCYLALASELKGQNAYMVETGSFPDQRLVALPEKLQKLFISELSKQMSSDEISDKDNLFDIGGTHHASNGRNFAKKRIGLMSILGKVSDVKTVLKESPTVSAVHLETAMGNQKKKRKKRTKTIFVEEIKKKNAKLKNPKGGLTQAGRDKFNRETGSKLKPGVKGKADTPEKMRRKGSFLTRFFTNPSGPMKDEKGRPTRLALSANAWGEPVPQDRAAAARLAAKGRSLLQRYENQKKNKVSKFNPYHDELGRFTSASGGKGGVKSGGRRTSKHPADFAITRGLASMAMRSLAGGYKSKAPKRKLKIERFNPKTKERRIVSQKPKEKTLSSREKRQQQSMDYDSLTTRNEQLKTRITPRTKSDTVKAGKVSDYMMVGVKRFKNKNHRNYATARVAQMTGGKARPKGMSKKYKMSKKSVRTYEAVLYRMFVSGRLKHGI